MIKSAASAASLEFAGERQDDGPACGQRGTGRSPASPREAALAADLITASLIRLLVVLGQYAILYGWWIPNPIYGYGYGVGMMRLIRMVMDMRSEIGELGSEKELCTLLRSKS